MKSKIITALIISVTPVLVSAQSIGISINIGSSKPSDVNELLWIFVSILSRLVPILIALAVLLFIWGVLRYVISTDPNSKKDAGKLIGYGIVSIFVMVSVWGLVNLIGNSLQIDIDGNGSPVLGPKNIYIENYSKIYQKDIIKQP